MNELQIQGIVIKALTFYWNCDVCKMLGWCEECDKDDNKDKCGYVVYDKLRDHIHAIDRIKAGRT